ncbi:MAG TPA: hypothetical protein VHU61_03005 [Solirubrobacteraceae bacterium]|jgi:hypothetical protein|nr:hypothetical protein [Solirubrobacteraceae bacterium]
MKRTVATVIATAAFVVPAQAFAAPIMGAPLPSAKSAQTGSGTTTTTTTTTPFRLTLNEQADRKALNAYATYLSTLLNQQTIGETNDSTFTATISSGCKAALEPLTQPPYEVNGTVQHTLTVLGQEMGDDLSINFDLAATPAFTKFSGVLTRLHWKQFSGAPLVVKRYVNKETNVLALAVSNLCLDASDAQIKPASVPDATHQFVKSYDEASTQANLGLSNLLTLMQTYEVPSEKTLVARISTLANELASQTKNDLLQSGTALSTVLESN